MQSEDNTLMGSLFDDADMLSDAQIQGLLGQHIDGQGVKVSVVDEQAKEIKVRLKRRPKQKSRGLSYFEPMEREVSNLNKTVTVEISLPGYMVAGMQSEAEYREAVRDYLIKKNRTWWYPRFLISSEGDKMRARDLFTRRVRLE